MQFVLIVCDTSARCSIGIKSIRSGKKGFQGLNHTSSIWMYVCVYVPIYSTTHRSRSLIYARRISAFDLSSSSLCIHTHSHLHIYVYRISAYPLENSRLFSLTLQHSLKRLIHCAQYIFFLLLFFLFLYTMYKYIWFLNVYDA